MLVLHVSSQEILVTQFFVAQFAHDPGGIDGLPPFPRLLLFFVGSLLFLFELSEVHSHSEVVVSHEVRWEEWERGTGGDEWGGN